MNNPTPSTSRGRGRGRVKELSSNERVAHWMHQREAKRLNKERWANRDAETKSPSRDGDDGNINQTPVKQEITDCESSLDRSRGKKQEVKLYVPPSLRGKKASSPSIDIETDTSKAKVFSSSVCLEKVANSECHMDHVAPVSTIVESTESLSNKLSIDSGDTSHQSQASEMTKTKGRGRGRKKPEVEIYMPRAMRAAKVGVKSSRNARDEKKKPVDSRQEEVKDDDVSHQTALSQSSLDSTESLADNSHKSNLVPSVIASKKLDDDSENLSSLPFHLNSSHSFAEDWKHGPLENINSYSPNNVESESSEANKIDSQLSDGSYTFEFYDPAVIAFLPSPQALEPPSDISNTMNKEADTFYHSDISKFNFQAIPVHSENWNSNNIASMCCSKPQKSSNENQSSPCASGNSNVNLKCNCSESFSLDSNINITSGHVKDDLQPLESDRETAEDFMEHNSGKDKDKDLSCCNQIPSVLADISGNSHSENMNSSGQQSIHQLVEHIHLVDCTESNKCKEREAQSSFLVDKQPKEKPEADDEDSWDALFDDNGDCLDESVIKELTEYVGKVEIDRPKINYLSYEPKEPELDLQAFSHIIEIYDFSPELKTIDIMTAFREFASRGFDVKWVDDTHALGVFSSDVAAKEALNLMHPMLKVRPMSEASKKGQSKARHCQEFLQPYKPRPETTSMAARRLVAGALGMAPRVSKEVREQERKKLTEAKEKRRQERQQKIDIWDGTFRKCAMDEEGTESL